MREGLGICQPVSAQRRPLLPATRLQCGRDARGCLDRALLNWAKRFGDQGSVESKLGNSWDVPATGTTTVPLAAGVNTIKVYNDAANGPDLDRIRIAEPGR